MLTNKIVKLVPIGVLVFMIGIIFTIGCSGPSQQTMEQEAQTHCLELRVRALGFVGDGSYDCLRCNACLEFDEYFLNKYCKYRSDASPDIRHITQQSNCEVWKEGYSLPKCVGETWKKKDCTPGWG